MLGDRNMVSGSIGARLWPSTHTNAPSRTNPTLSDRITPLQNRQGDQSVGETAETDQHQERAFPVVSWPCLWITALRHVIKGDQDCWQCEDGVNEKNPTPTEMIDNPPAQQWAGSSCQRGKARPGADRFTALTFRESRTDDS